jgi:hypothetical protein
MKPNEPTVAPAGCAITPSFLEQIAQNPEITPEKLEQFMNLRAAILYIGDGLRRLYARLRMVRPRGLREVPD